MNPSLSGYHFDEVILAALRLKTARDERDAYVQSCFSTRHKGDGLATLAAYNHAVADFETAGLAWIERAFPK